MPQLIHGILHATIYGIDKLQTGNGLLCCKKSFTKFLGELKRTMCSCGEIVGGSGIYATIDLDKARVGRTRILEHASNNPDWHEHFHIYCAHWIYNIIFTVKNVNVVGAELIGRASVRVEEIIKGNLVDKWVELLDENHNPILGSSKIHVKLQFLSVTQDSSWSQGINNPKYLGVPLTFFNQRQGCRVTLYQDAHVRNDYGAKFIHLGGQPYEPNRCWEDIFYAINNARHLIYITGWSVFTEITLLRDPERRIDGITLGELLKKKANEGVIVLLLVWDDRSSVVELKKDGLMATHDENTEAYFRNTSVKCYLCPRNPDDGRSIIQGFEISTMFTHHQKTVIVDSEVVVPQEGTTTRRILSFVGGIDLCDGRYDTQEHPLFGSLGTTYYHDFHQPNFEGSSIKKGGPREPWHDVHCKLEGPIAWDVLYNFEQRWKKQVGDKFLIPPNKLHVIMINPSTSISNDTDTWNVQLFRSIDGGAAFGFPDTPIEASEMGLVSGKENIIDRSIQDAYIHAIRRAKNFIYIENQYFLGSSFGWRPNGIKVEDINALHLIPKELSLKIVSKIEAGERFTVYIVIPMWPEGIPESGSVQAILDWQRRTMDMMYSDIIQSLHRKRSSADPREYLTFFCLGNREKMKVGEYEPPEKPEPDTDYFRAQQARRFMIYVHAKMMIVDDEYIIVGSANINQRSMDGARDTEIAMGAYQPHHLVDSSGPAKGHIYEFRMSLWYEHLNTVEISFQYPETVECVRRLNQIAERNWKIYSDDTIIEDLPGHLLRYPIQVSSNGSITTLEGFHFFPDTKAKVLGDKSDYLPPILTT